MTGLAMIARTYFVRGRVQGVGYRNFAQAVAVPLGVVGYARNLDDGRVEVYGVATAAKLDEFAGALRLGPRWSEVRDVAVLEAAVNLSFKSFRIER